MTILKDYGNGILKAVLNNGNVNYISVREYDFYDAMDARETDRHFRREKQWLDHFSAQRNARAL